MCGGALSAACADCADACELAATTKAAVNAASFAIDISSLLPLTRIQFGLAQSRAIQLERRTTPADVNGGEACGVHSVAQRSQIHVRTAVGLRLIDRYDHR